MIQGQYHESEYAWGKKIMTFNHIPHICFDSIFFFRNARIDYDKFSTLVVHQSSKGLLWIRYPTMRN